MVIFVCFAPDQPYVVNRTSSSTQVSELNSTQERFRWFYNHQNGNCTRDIKNAIFNSSATSFFRLDSVRTDDCWCETCPLRVPSHSRVVWSHGSQSVFFLFFNFLTINQSTHNHPLQQPPSTTTRLFRANKPPNQLPTSPTQEITFRRHGTTKGELGEMYVGTLSAGNEQPFTPGAAVFELPLLTRRRE